MRNLKKIIEKWRPFLHGMGSIDLFPSPRKVERRRDYKYDFSVDIGSIEDGFKKDAENIKGYWSMVISDTESDKKKHK